MLPRLRCQEFAMTNVERARILCVDDEQLVLDGLSRTLRSHYVVETVTSGAQALDRLRTGEPYAVVVSDQRMPQMDGVRLLAHIRTVAPDTVRVLLTGQADMESAIAAVNEGNIFRFLTKPCSTENLLKALEASIEQYRLVTSEKFCSRKLCAAASRPSLTSSPWPIPPLSAVPHASARVWMS